MAIIKTGVNGGFTGKAGTVVGYHRLGKWVIRGLPRLSAQNKRGTAEQNAVRSVFTKTRKLLFPVLDFVRAGFGLEGRSKQMTAHNAAMSYNMRNAFTPEKEIDFSKVLFCYGDLAGALNPTLAKEGTALRFSWTDNTDEVNAMWRDQAMILAYDDMLTDSKKQHQPKGYYLLSGARRNVCTDSIEIPPPSIGNTLHAYIAFISDDRQRVSMSAYVGEIVF